MSTSAYTAWIRTIHEEIAKHEMSRMPCLPACIAFREAVRNSADGEGVALINTILDILKTTPKKQFFVTICGLQIIDFAEHFLREIIATDEPLRIPLCEAVIKARLTGCSGSLKINLSTLRDLAARSADTEIYELCSEACEIECDAALMAEMHDGVLARSVGVF